jgi:hypothetical protein
VAFSVEAFVVVAAFTFCDVATSQNVLLQA